MEEGKDDTLEQNASFSFNYTHRLFNNTCPTPTNSPYNIETDIVTIRNITHESNPKPYNQTKPTSIGPNNESPFQINQENTRDPQTIKEI